MTLRRLLIVALSVPIILTALYATTVQRGPWSMREESAWEVAASGYVPIQTRIYDEQRMPAYPRPLRWLAPLFADVHAVDVRLRWRYWHEEVFPAFDTAPDFEVAKLAAARPAA